MTFEACRLEFEKLSNRSMSMPISGAIVWALIAFLTNVVDQRYSIIIMFCCTGLIFPIALGISKIRKEKLLSSQNPFSKLMGQSIIMVNLLWAIHIPLFIYSPDFVPLSLGIALGLHWVIYSWIIQHPLGIIHSILRTFLILSMWLIFRENSLVYICFAIIVTYLFSLYQMYTRKIMTT